MIGWVASLSAVIIKGHNSPGTESLWGRRKVLRISQVLQCSTFASERPQVRRWGRQTCFLPWAPSNLVMPLTVIQYSSALSMYIKWGVAQLHSYVGHILWANRAHSMHYCHIAASCLLTYTSVDFHTLHYSSISRGVTKGHGVRITRAANHSGGAEILRGCQNVPTMSHVHSSIQ